MKSNEELVYALLESTSLKLANAEVQIAQTRELVERSNAAIVASLRLLAWEDLEQFVTNKA